MGQEVVFVDEFCRRVVCARDGDRDVDMDEEGCSGISGFVCHVTFNGVTDKMRTRSRSRSRSYLVPEQHHGFCSAALEAKWGRSWLTSHRVPAVHVGRDM